MTISSSPANTSVQQANPDPGITAAYRRAFDYVSQAMPAGRVVLVDLGCGGGQKDGQLLATLQTAGKPAYYVPADVSVSLAIEAAHRVGMMKGCDGVAPLVLDLAQTSDLSDVLSGIVGASKPRILTFFGMIPNFEPDPIVARLAAVLRPADLLVFSANLAPGHDYPAGLKCVMPQYDNPLTREWLMAFLRTPTLLYF